MIALTPRQRETVRLLCRGLVHKEVAHEMGISVRAVRKYLSLVRKRTGARTTVQAVAMICAARIVLALMLLIGPALAHDNWISRGGHRNAAGEWCCGEGDCFVIPEEQVELRGDQYVVQLKLFDGQTYAEERVPYLEAQPSPDGKFWRCRRPDGTRRCFFAPPPGT